MVQERIIYTNIYIYKKRIETREILELNLAQNQNTQLQSKTDVRTGTFATYLQTSQTPEYPESIVEGHKFNYLNQLLLFKLDHLEVNIFIL
jgi:hypothetical protein